MPPRKRTAAKKTARYAGDTGQQPATSTESAKRPGKAPSVAVGDVVRLAPDEDNPDAPAQYAQVVAKVDGTEHRDAGALVVPLPEPRWMPLSSFAAD